MAGGVIRITPEQVRQYAGNIKRKQAEVETFFKSIQNEISNATQVWEGKASEAYVREFERIKQELGKQLNTCLDNLGRSMESVATALEQADTEIANKLKA